MTLRVLVTGANGQDGAYLCNSLLDKGYEVHACLRRGSTPKTGRLKFLDIVDKITIHQVDITDYASVVRLLNLIKPNRIYNLAAQSFVQDSFDNPMVTSRINFDAVTNMLEAIRVFGIDTKFYQASTSEMFGQVLRDPQDENTPFNPMSPYAVSKCAAHYLVKNYRIAYGMECVSGILFNHESELRGREFVTRKITSGLARIANGDTQPIKLGNCDSKRDWGYAPDYVDAMQAIIEDGKNTDYVVATNSISSVRDFFILSANIAGFNAEIEGEGVNEKCVDTLSGRILYEVDEKYYRPSEVAYLRGDNRKIFEDIGWSPSTSLSQMCEKMVSFDMDLISGSLQFDYTV